jgi:hypothetical protein
MTKPWPKYGSAIFKIWLSHEKIWLNNGQNMFYFSTNVNRVG